MGGPFSFQAVCMHSKPYDLAIVGSGILGLAHALAALKLGLRTVVIERDARPVGASIRNFGFVTITGQRRGTSWARAKRSAQVWAEVATRAGMEIEHRGLVVIGRRPEAMPILESFCETEMGHGCELLSARVARDRFPMLRPATLAGALWSSHDLRVESRTAIPRLAAWLKSQGVDFILSTAVRAVSPPRIETADGTVHAGAAIVCPGDDLVTLFPQVIAARGVRRCKLQMLRLADPGFRLPGSVMSDLSLVRYRGYADLPQSQALRTRLEQEQPSHLAHGIHLIVVQSADGSLVVGDSHHYGVTLDPFAESAIEDLILEELRDTLGVRPPVLERWTGTYASATDDMFTDAPEPAVRVVMVTGGNGASTSFAIAEETIADLFETRQGDAA